MLKNRYFILSILIIGCNHSDKISNSDRNLYSNQFLERQQNINIQKSYNQFLEEKNIESINLIKNRKFKEIINLNIKLQSNFKDDIKFEKNIEFELSSISNSRENLEAILNDFIKEYPQSYVPYLYRGVYFEGKGWQSRGGKFANEIKNERFKWMKHYHELAISDLNKSISKNKNILHTYVFNIKLGAVNNDSLAFKKNLDAAMKIRPESYGLWMTVAGFSAPRWGGSISKIQEVLDFSSRYHSKNPLLENLSSVIIIEQADNAYNSGDYELSKELYETAIEEGFQASPRMRQFNPVIGLIDIYFKEGNSNKACELVKAYLNSNPVSWEAQTSAVWCKTYNHL